MSLVAYESSDDSDTEETSISESFFNRKPGNLFSLLPAPKKLASATLSNDEEPFRGPKSNSPPKGNTFNENNQDPQMLKSGLIFNLPKPKKRTEPVKIAIPELLKGDSESDEDEPVRKKTMLHGQGVGLSSLLPQPKNIVVKETHRALVPHSLNKRPDTKASKSAPSVLSSSASPSAIKAAAKSAALQLAKQIAADDQDSDEELAPENYFSLGESSQPLQPAVVPNLDSESEGMAALLPFPTRIETGTFQSDAPLDFGSNHDGAGGGDWGDEQHQQQSSAGPEAYAQGYYNEAYYQGPEPGLAEADEPGSSVLFDDEAFMRLQGKRNRGKEEVKFLEIKGDDQLSGNQQWMTKNITEEKQERKSFSKKKGDQPTGQQRRKHQITYLIHQAKERELELKNNWAENKLTRRQTQAKYGF